MKLIVIGISGITGGGKTTLATSLHQFLSDHNNADTFNGFHINDVVLIQQDKYFHVRNSPLHTWIPEINFINREILSAMDMDRFANDVNEIVKKLSDYNVSNDQSNIDSTRCNINIVIIEGFLIYNDQRINQLCQLRFHLYLSFEVGYARRLTRNFKHINPDPRWYWENYAWPLYKKHLNEVPNKSELVYLNGEDPVDSIFDQAQSKIVEFLTNQIEY